MFSEFSTQTKFWWKCNKGHEWQSTIAHRTFMKSGCPYCIGRKHLPIRCIETGKIFSSYTEAANTYGLSAGGAISKCCKGKQKTAGGYHWEFVKE